MNIKQSNESSCIFYASNLLSMQLHPHEQAKFGQSMNIGPLNLWLEGLKQCILLHFR